ncbi:mobilization protein, partial [Acinetobacter baumannii]|nr:mobilization protein [Acinetobacter baumannii]
ERKDDTRRKILLGSYLIKKMQANEANKEKILAELNEYLTENRDRQLFDLPDIEA